MSLLRSRFVQAVLVLVIAFVVLRFGIQPPAPWSVLTLYMSIVLLAVLVFVSSDSDSWREFVRPIRATLVSPDRRHARLGLLIALPLLLGYYAYTQAAAKPRSEEHTSELQSRSDLVCRLLLEKKNKDATLGRPQRCRASALHAMTQH